MHKYFIAPFFFLLFFHANAQNYGRYKVVFTDGTSKIVKGRIAYVVNGDSLPKDVLICRKHTIVPSQTQSIAWLVGYDEQGLQGLPSDDKRFWLFKTINGKISAYAALPNGRGLEYLEKDGVRVPFTIENILPLLNDNASLYKRYERSLKVFQRQKRHPNAGLLEASFVSLSVIGLCIYSLYATPVAALTDIAVIGTTSVLIAARISRLYPLEAIRQYNYMQ